ncbi:unnamed protein product [Allacma fusca]|uniref:Pacifastin domain-containing protein n=1 Tax=Allacma fusca TaxID=39272 RepID=A0A8J2KVH5_9HEXA|nr:unnamed protein product [Allacma fusca]
MSEDGVRYSDSDLAKMKSFSRLAKYIIIAWCFAAVFILVQQTFYRDTVILDQKTSSNVIHKIQYIFSSNNQKLDDADVTSKCTPGQLFKPDGCNTCQCDKDGNPVACTKIACPNPKDPIAILI